MTMTRVQKAIADDEQAEYLAGNIMRDSHLNAIRRMITEHDNMLVHDMGRRVVGPSEMHMREFQLAELILLDLGYSEKDIYE